MMKIFFTTLFLLISGHLYSQSQIGLKIGHKLTLADVEGNLFVKCRYDNGESRIFHECSGEVFREGNYSYFLGPKTKDFNRVDLIVNIPGKTPYKMIGLHYKGKKGRTKREINIKNAANFTDNTCNIFSPKMPLVIGQTFIEYKLYHSRKSSTQFGQIQISVTQKDKIHCKDGKFFSSYSSTCWPSKRKNLCAQYFNRCIK